jgi:hypothetical protein
MAGQILLVEIAPAGERRSRIAGLGRIQKPAKFKFTTADVLLGCALLVARMAELADATDSKSVAL